MNWELFKGIASMMPKKILIYSMSDSRLKNFVQSWQHLLDIQLLNESGLSRFLRGEKEGILLYDKLDTFPKCNKISLSELYDKMLDSLQKITEKQKHECELLYAGGGCYRFRHQLSIVAIIQNEGAYIREWLDYHIMAGVDCFYLYDNDSTDDTTDILQDYINAGWVQYKYWPGKNQQSNAYKNALDEHRFETKWMAIIDGDEFIHPLEYKSIQEIVEEIIADNHNASGVCINWRIFGSSGHKRKPSNGLLNNFCRRSIDSYVQNMFVKVIFNPRRAYDVHIHNAIFFEDNYSVNCIGERVLWSRNGHRLLDKICINHYYLKSWEEWKERRSRGKADRSERRSDNEFFNTDTAANEIYDDGILRYRSLCLENPRKITVLSKHSGEENIIESINDVSMRLAKEVTLGSVTLTAEELFCYWHDWHISTNKNDDIDIVGGKLLSQLFALQRVSIYEVEMFLDFIFPLTKNIKYVEQVLVPEILELVKRNAKNRKVGWGRHVRLTDLFSGVIRIRLLGSGCFAKVDNQLAQCPMDINDKVFPDGSLVLSNSGEMYLTVFCKGSGELNIVCQGVDARDNNNEYIPMSVEYTSLQYNYSEILEKPIVASQIHPYIVKKQVKDGEKIELVIRWRPIKLESRDFLEIARRIYSNI